MIMKKIITICNISVAILIAIGLQQFFVAGFTYKFVDFNSFGIYNWLMQICYLTFVITLAIRAQENV